MNRLLSFLFVCLMHVSLAVASTYNLSVEVTPNGSGSLSTSGGTYEEGSTVYLRTYGNTGYVFKGWYDGETLLSSSSSFNYTMPAKDVLVKAKYEYDPTVPGNPSMPDTTTYYSFNAIVSPHGAGSLNSTNARYVAGATVSLRTYNNTGYKFVGWQDANGVNLSSSTSYNYTMPNHDVTLTALYSYDPSVPANPDSMATRYTVNVVSKPMGGGSFNTTSATVEEGGNVRLYAYTNTGYQFLHWENEQGEIISSEQNFYYVIPHGNTKVYGVFDFNPAPPSNPNKNYWNKELGEVIIDDFTPGYLGSAVSNAISGSNRSDVAMITVAGKMNDNDFGIANDYTNCTLLDISRVTGITNIPSYAFDYTNLESVYLPVTIESIGYRAFADCKQLTALTVYAMVPPTLESNVFQGIQEGLVVYVPAAAIAQYQDADGWKDFTILPIQEDIRSISISLPEGANASDYAQMWLELTNTKSGQRMHYVMTDRQTYTFANIIRNTSWNVTLRNERGDVFGQIENVEVKDEDVTVTFASLSKPQNVSLSVLTPDGYDVTNQVQVTWTDAQGNYVAQGASLFGLPVGCQVNYRMALSQELAMTYDTPSAVEYTLKDGSNALTCHLQAIKKLTISGKVKDASTGLPLSGTVISASQTFGGKYSKTVSTKTDAKGNYVLTVSNVPTSLAVSASDYISQTIVCDSLMTGEDVVTIPDVSLKGISGAVVTLGLTYTKCPSEDGNEETFQEWYADYNNVTYSIFNKTKQKSINLFNVQYPQIVLLEEVDEGDVLEMTATSKVNAFMPVKTTATIDAEQRANAAFNIVELGKIKSAFAKNSNAAVVGSLYDANGKLVKSYDYSNASLTINDLTDGSYTLVTMGASKLFNSIYDLSQLPQTGLVLGSDYTQTTVDVKSGKVCAIDIAEVPTLDESKLYYTGDNTSFTVNKSSIVAGNYLTLTGHLDFKSAYAGNVSNVNLIVDLPESCEFVENSVMVGNNTSSYIIQDNRITIPMARYTDRVRFCIIPTLGGEYAPSALAQFDIDGETITQPIGSANYTAKDLSINVPTEVAKTTIPVSGTAIGASTIEVYDGDVLVGQTTSLANGSWTMTCELNDPYNLSTHNISAKVTTKSGMVLTSEMTVVTYNKDKIEAEKVTMLYYNPEMDKEYNIVFDLINGTVTPSSFYFFPYKSWPNWQGSGTEPKDFTFVVDLSNNDTTIVKAVTVGVYTKQNNWVYLDASYNKNKDRWIATSQFEESNLPTGVKVDFDAFVEPVIDVRTIDNAFSFRKSSIANIDILKDLVGELTSSLDYELSSDDEWVNQYLEVSNILGINELDLDNEDCFINEDNYLDFLSDCEATIQKTWNIDQFLTQDVYGNISSFSSTLHDFITVENLDGLTEEDIDHDLYIKYVLSDNSSIYVFQNETHYELLDFTKNVKYIFDLSTTSSQVRSQRAISAEEQILSYVRRIKELGDKIGDHLEVVSDGLDWAQNAIDMWMDDATSKHKDIMQRLAKIGRESKKAGTQLHGVERFALRLELSTLKNSIIVMEGVEKTIKALGKSIAAFGLISDIASAYEDLNSYYNLSIHPKLKDCPANPDKAQEIKNNIIGEAVFSGVYYVGNFVLDLASLEIIPAGIIAAPETGGVSLSAVGAAVGKIASSIAIDKIHSSHVESKIRDFSRRITNLKCEDDKCPKCHKKPCECEKPCPTCGQKPCICCDYCHSYPCKCQRCHRCGKRVQECTCKPCKKCGHIDCICEPEPKVDPIHDPSGFVYEGVFSNRLEGVMATCYYKEIVEDMYGDLHENIVKWNAEEYAQENPLFTDENGFYRWDVPQGLWQVKFEKDGYQTTYSEWLPVPPPQLDVNITMKQNVQPNVKNARAYEDAVEVEFDKYMMPELLNTENIIVMAGGKQVEGSVVMLNEEVKYEGESETFASKVRFNTSTPFEGTEVTLMVNNRVKSYAGIRMQDNYSQSFTIEQEIRKIVCDSTTVVGYGHSGVIPVTVLPASASAGKVLNVRSSSSMILATDIASIKLDNNGCASIPVSGELPGTAALTFTIDGYELSATTIVNVEQIENVEIEAPKANIASGTTVTKGTSITLTCATEGATIYYTLDGSCPCEETTRLTYTEPIVINKTVTIKAMAVAPDMTDSDIAEFTYFVTTKVEVPTASLPSGSSVYRGTTVKLSSESKDMKIWYTTDGTSPDVENGSRKQYTEPVVISSDMTLKAMTENEDGETSDVATFIYTILQSKTGVVLNNGWTWVSFNMKNDALSSVNTAMASSSWTSDDVIKDNKYVDMYSANQKKWIGTLSKQGALKNTQMYKVHSSKAQTVELSGEAVNPAETSITVGSGWNYISYLPLVSMSVSEALSNYAAQSGDVIKSQDAFATYSTTNGWEGDLTALTVGRGYMLKRGANAAQTTFTYPTESPASPAKSVAHAKSYRYADNMNIIGEVVGISVEDGDSLVAYVNGEIRGASRLERNKKLFLTVQGDEDAKMAIVLVRDGEIIATASNMIGYQCNNVLGTSDAPTAITFVTDDSGLDSNIGNVKAIYGINGIKMNTRHLNNIPSGTYIIFSEKNGNTCVTKFIK